MATLNIPAQSLDGLSKLLTLPDELIDTIIVSLEKNAVSLDAISSVSKQIAATTGFEAGEVASISQAYVSLLILQSQTYENIDELADKLLTACRESGFDGLKFDEGQVLATKSRLVRLLSIEPLYLSAKAVHIKFEQNNLFSNANVMTEILPVFGYSVDEQPKTLMIAHQLGVHYYEDGGHKTAYFRMDIDELDELIEVLSRAKRKGDSLKAFIETANVPYLENV